MRRIGETSETERHMSKTCGGRDGQEKTELAREGGGQKKSSQKHNKDGARGNNGA